MLPSVQDRGGDMGGGSSATAPADMQRVATDTTAIARRIDSFFLILNFSIQNLTYPPAWP
ncbi:hypothetical protein LAWASA_4118 [Lawsonibacter asaccharolyticus]|nr:hypothetical protein LAWASA_4118 [Lawsonibacter asaccharolyticus]